MKKSKLIFIYVLFDFLSALVAWAIFFYLRKVIIEDAEFIANDRFFIGISSIPFAWLVLYYIAGNYHAVFKRHRLRDFGESFFLSLIGCLIVFFVLLINDAYSSYQMYYKSFLLLFGIHFGITVLFRLIITSRVVKLVHAGKIGFPTLIIGGNEKALNVYNEINDLKNSPGYQFKGFVSTNGVDRALMDVPLEHYGNLSTVDSVIEQEKIEEVIIAVESSEHENLNKIINSLDNKDVNIKLIPDTYDILTGSVKSTAIFGALLMEVNKDNMPRWQQSIKRLFDILVSVVAIILLLPVFLTLAIVVKTTSKGKVFFTQERIGIYGKPFNIYKFRSMVNDAESDGPQLSSSNDSRITKVGKFMRKTRLDEIPQFYNVIKGDMSLVGPRPERAYYIEKIMQVAPHYKHLQRVKPGITSWGQVKYGYAENVNEMVQRLQYDILYVENRSLALDIKILIYTVLIVLKGSGK